LKWLVIDASTLVSGTGSDRERLLALID